jgi:hypothetical protein
VWEHELKEPKKVVAKIKRYYENEFDTIVKQTHKQAKEAGLRQKDVKSAVEKAKGHK